MKGFDVLKVKSAVKSRGNFDLSRTHLTTMDFGQIVPLLSEETVPGDKFSITGNFFSRLAPLVKPTYGKFQFKTVAGFVPYHMVAFDADAWLAGKTSFEGSTPVQRFITVYELADFLVANTVSTTVGATAANCDYSYTNSGGTVTYRKWTNAGRYWVKVLNALGYAVPQCIDYQSGSVWMTTTSKIKLSAYPLLAFFKLYNDYMSQSQRFNTSPLSTLLQCIKYAKVYISNSYYVPATGEVKHLSLNVFFDALLLNYENDYFTSAWATPNNAISAAENITGADVPSLAGTYHSNVLSTFDDNELVTDTDTVGGRTVSVIGQRALDFLESFDNWVRRNNYSGSRAVQQIYSRFGVKTDDYKSHYANILSTESLPVQVGDVTATADSTSVPLGDYAGKGIMSGSKGVSCQVSDYGVLLILGYFTVTPMNPYGFDKKVLRTSPLDYYNPEFDGIGAEPISLGEVFENPIAPSTDTSVMTGVFGFTERYNAYRYGRDQITGEFRNYHSGADMNTWHTGRNLAALRSSGNLVAQSTSMNTLEQADSQYNRIFSVTSGDVDHFYLTANFDVKASRPMLNLNQVVNLGEGDTMVPRNGNVIS